MKCPKCKHISFDYNDTCPRCRKDLSGERERLNLPSYKPDPPALLDSLMEAQSPAADGIPAGGDPGAEEAAASPEPGIDSEAEITLDLEESPQDKEEELLTLMDEETEPADKNKDQEELAVDLDAMGFEGFEMEVEEDEEDKSS